MPYTKGAFFYPQFWNENDQNVKCAVFLFRIPIPEWIEHHSNHSSPRGRMNRMLCTTAQATVLVDLSVIGIISAAHVIISMTTKI